MAGQTISATRASSPARKRIWWRRLIVTGLVLANLVVLGGIAIVWYWADRASSEIATIPAHQLPSIDVASGEPAQPRNFLLIGSDSRERLPEDFPDFFGTAPGERADVIMVVRVLPEDNRLQVLSIPRDLKVGIPGHGEDKINAALALGGPDLMVQTVRSVVGVPLHHYVQLDFAGFSEIVEALGGVTMYFPHPARDLKSGLDVPSGIVELDGPMALAYARSRSYQEHRDGRWVSVEADDLGRIKRQQRLIFAILEEARRPQTVTELAGLVEVLGENVEADSALGSRTLIQLAWDMRSVGPADLDAASLPVEPLFEGGVAYLVPKEPQADDVLRAFRQGELMHAVADGLPRLQVLNGNGVQGSAGRLAELLEEEGFPVEEIGDADRSDYRTTVVIARPEQLHRAKLVAEHLGFGQVVPGEVPSHVDVIVITGSDATAA